MTNNVVIKKARKLREHSPFSHPITEKVLHNDEKKMQVIEKHMQCILDTLGLDLDHPSIAETPKRIAKMFVQELFSGLNPESFPKLSFVPLENTAEPGKMILMKNIQVQSICEHHFLPMTGLAHFAYIPEKKIIGLSKINRIIQFFAKRPQLQERLTAQIMDCMAKILQTKDLAFLMELDHYCVKLRGVTDASSITITSDFLGCFQSDNALKEEFFRKISR